MQTAAEALQDHRLALSEVLQALAADGIVSKADADKLVADRRLHRGDHHPLLVIADQKWRSVKPPQKLLSLEWLTEWLARQTGMEYFHIDPLKINFAAVTEVMSSHYAARFKVLPVELYNLAKSIKGAAQKGGEQRSGIGNFEQLVEIGQTNKQFDANDQHIVHVVDW